MSINTLLLCARCIDQTGHAKKTEQHRISGAVVVVDCCFSGITRLFSSFSLAFTYVKELELPAINVVKRNKPVV